MRRLIPFVLLLALVSTACKIRLDTSVVVNADESGTFAIEMGLDEEFRQFAEEGGGEFDILDGMEDVPSDWTVDTFSDGEFEGVIPSGRWNRR